MMIDDHDVTLERFAPHFGDKAALELRTLLARTTLGTRIELLPQGTRFRKHRQLGAIASVGFLVPIGDGTKLVDLFQSRQYRLICEIVKLLAAKVVATSLHVRDTNLPLARDRLGRVFAV